MKVQLRLEIKDSQIDGKNSKIRPITYTQA